MIESWKPQWGEVGEERLRRRLEAEGYSVVRNTYPRGTFFPDHTHAYAVKAALLNGQLRVRMQGQEFILRPGDAIRVPAGEVHSAEVVGEEEVISLDGTRSDTAPRRGSS